MDKRIRADVFRTRLQEAMSLKKVTRSALSRAANVDRSTIGSFSKTIIPVCQMRNWLLILQAP